MTFPCLIAGLVVVVPALFAQAVEGTVVDSATKTPIGGVAVTIEGAGKPPYHATTDQNGGFRVEGVQDGQYTAKFSKKDFLAPSTRSPATRPFRVSAGSAPIRLQAELTPMGKILGRVFDADGHPVPAAEVLIDSSRSGRSVSSDPQGNFSFQTDPGEYFLIVRPPAGLKPPASKEDERLGWVDTYYPGVSDRAAAAKIVVRAGAELWGTDIRLRSGPVYHLRGVVLDPDGHSAPRVAVKATPVDETVPANILVESADDGSFEFPALPDGEWVMSAEMEIGGGKVRAFAEARVSGRDLDRVELRLSEPFTLAGSIFLDGGGVQGMDKKATIFLRPLVGASEGLPTGVLDPQGAFRIANVYPGAYKIVAAAPGQPYFLASLSMGDRDVLGQSVELVSGAIPIKVAFESKGGGVHGSVEDCGAATVVLKPLDAALQEPQFIQTARCGEDGRFDIQNVRPGDYYALALNPWEGPQQLLSAFDQALANKAVTVHVRRGEVAPLDLKVR